VGRRKWVWKDEPPRFKPRRLASGKVLYYYQAAGKQIPLGSNRIAALEEWARLEAGGTNAAKFPRVTVLYREHIKGYARSTREHYCIALDNLDLAFKAFTLEQIEPKHIKAYIRRRTKKGAAMFEKRVGSAFFNWAREEGHTKAANPFHGVKFSKAERKGYPTGRRKRYVTDAEYRAVWSAGDAVLQDAMDLAYRTGQRPGDVLKARRQDIADGALWFAQEKTDERLGVNIVGELARVLERILARSRAVASVYLIADRKGPARALQRAERSLPQGPRRCDLAVPRHPGEDGYRPTGFEEGAALLGHADETTTNIYRRSRGDIVEPLERKI
jgi:integrase